MSANESCVRSVRSGLQRPRGHRPGSVVSNPVHLPTGPCSSFNRYDNRRGTILCSLSTFYLVRNADQTCPVPRMEFIAPATLPGDAAFLAPGNDAAPRRRRKGLKEGSVPHNRIFCPSCIARYSFLQKPPNLPPPRRRAELFR